MAAIQSQEGQVGFKTQAAAGTYLDPGAAAPNDGYFVPIQSGSLAGQVDLLTPDAEIGGNRDIADAVRGPISFAGTYDWYSRWKALAFFFKAGLGSVATVTAGTTEGTDLIGTHTITPIDTGELPFVSIEEAIGGSLEVFNYTDAKLNELHLEADADGFFMGNSSWIAKTQTSGNTKTAAPRWDTTPLTIGTQIDITIGGSTFCVRDFSFDLSNNLEDGVFCLGSDTVSTITEKRRDVTMSMTVRPENINLWKQAVYGSTVATSHTSGLAVKQAVVVTITSSEDLGTGLVGTKFSATLTFPQVAIEPFELEPSGDDVLEWGLDLRALRPAPAVGIMTAVVVNDDDVVA